MALNIPIRVIGDSCSGILVVLLASFLWMLWPIIVAGFDPAAKQFGVYITTIPSIGGKLVAIVDTPCALWKVCCSALFGWQTFPIGVTAAIVMVGHGNLPMRIGGHAAWMSASPAERAEFGNSSLIRPDFAAVIRATCYNCAMSTMLSYTLTIEPHPDEGGYLAFFPALPECHNWGATCEEAPINAEEVLIGYVEAVQKNGQSIPEAK